MAEKMIGFASTTRVDEFCEEVSELLRWFASILKEPEDTEDEWLSSTFVSDESRLADFFYLDSELEQLEKLSGINGLEMRDLLCDVAHALRQGKRTGESQTPL
jgi:hypothetical protein